MRVDDLIAAIEKELPEDAAQLRDARDILLVVAVNKKLRARLAAAEADREGLRKQVRRFSVATRLMRQSCQEALDRLEDAVQNSETVAYGTLPLVYAVDVAGRVVAKLEGRVHGS